MSNKTVLGETVRGSIDYLDVFDKPDRVTIVSMVTDEFTSMCPITGQPDYGKVTIEYIPHRFCIESKSLKLYLLKYRNEGHFCEALSEEILMDVMKFAKPAFARVTVEQKPRGGVGITATSEGQYRPESEVPTDD